MTELPMIEQVRRVLLQGPAFSEEIAIELGLSIQKTTAYLSRLLNDRKVVRSEKRMTRNNNMSGYMYALPTKTWKFWTTAETAKLKTLKNKTPHEAARELGRSVPAVRSQAKRMGIDLDSNNKNYWPVEKRMEALGLRNEGKTREEIAELLAVPLPTIKNWIAKEPKKPKACFHCGVTDVKFHTWDLTLCALGRKHKRPILCGPCDKELNKQMLIFFNIPNGAKIAEEYAADEQPRLDLPKPKFNY